MNVDIEILVKGVGKLDIQTKESEDFGVPLTFNLSDIKDISSRKASFSKTIKIIGTKENNKIFNHLYEIKGQNFNFDMTRKHECVLMVNKNPVLDGFLVLKKINKLLVGTKFEVVYEIVMFDEVKNFFDDLGTKKLGDLDFSSGFTFQGINYSAGDHNLTDQLVAENFGDNTKDFTSIYSYGIVDYGYDLYNGKFPYAALSNGILYPHIYQRAIIDRIFYETDGYSYTSNYFNGSSHSGFFTNMVNVYNKKIDFTNLRLCEHCSDGGFITGYSTYDLPIGQSYYCNIDGYYVNPYRLESFFTNVTGTTSGIEVNSEGNYNLKIRFDITDDRGATSIDGCPGLGDPTYYKIMKYSSIEGTISTVFSVSNEDIRVDEDDIDFVYESDWVLSEDCALGDNFFIRIEPGSQKQEDNYSNCFNNSIKVYGDGASLELEWVRNLDVQYSGITEPLIRISDVLPDMTQADFMRNHIKMANLFIWSNNDDSKNLSIEPRDDFYKQINTISNWSDKVDYNKKVEIKSLISDISNEITFEYTEGDDFYSQEYISKWDETYGSKVIDLDNPYLKENQQVKLDYQSYLMDDFSQMTFPKLYDKDNSFQTMYDDRLEFEPMVGFVDIGSMIQYNIAGYIDGGQRNKKSWYKNWITHAKVMGGFSYDLNYETTGETFSITDYDNTRGLYKIFWENYMNNIIDDDSRIVTYYINLSMVDILQLDFRKRVDIDGQRYFLEKVEFDPSNITPSKVTLLKIIDPVIEGSFDTWFLLKNDSGDYITTSDGDDGLGDNGDRIIIN